MSEREMWAIILVSEPLGDHRWRYTVGEAKKMREPNERLWMLAKVGTVYTAYNECEYHTRPWVTSIAEGTVVRMRQRRNPAGEIERWFNQANPANALANTEGRRRETMANETRICCKCGCPRSHVEYRKELTADQAERNKQHNGKGRLPSMSIYVRKPEIPHPERLRVTCDWCGYRWNVVCKDAGEGKEPANPIIEVMAEPARLSVNGEDFRSAPPWRITIIADGFTFQGVERLYHKKDAADRESLRLASVIGCEVRMEE